MNFVDEFELNKDKTLFYVLNLIKNDLYFCTVEARIWMIEHLKIQSHNYVNQIFSSLYKDGKIMRICNTYYTTKELYIDNIDLIMYRILIEQGDKRVGCYSEQTLLNKYGLIDQVPTTISILSTISTQNLTDKRFIVKKIDLDLDKRQMVNVLVQTPEIFEFLILCYQSKKYSLGYSIGHILTKFCVINNLNEIDFCSYLLENDMPNGYLYHVQRAARKEAIKCLKG